jgi:hypothetical protein
VSRFEQTQVENFITLAQLGFQTGSSWVKRQPPGSPKWKFEMKDRNSNSSAVPQGELRLKNTIRIGLSTATALFLSWSTVFAWSQAAPQDEQCGATQDQQTQQSESTDGPASQPDACAPSKPTTTVPTQAPAPNPAPAAQKAEDSEGKQTKRMFWIVPNFAAVDAHTQLPPLSGREKFVLATKDSVDYSSFVWTGLISAQSMALKSYPELHQGLKGYGRYYWRAFADQASGSFFTEAIVPALAHEDPRYYTLGQGGFFRRTAYALSRVFVTKTDSGGTRINTSELVGNGLEAGLANLYYPPEERSFSNTAQNWATQLEAAALNNVIREFWPDIHRKIFRQK